MVRVEVIQAILYKLSSLVSQNVSEGDKSLHEVLKQQKNEKGRFLGCFPKNTVTAGFLKYIFFLNFLHA